MHFITVVLIARHNGSNVLQCNTNRTTVHGINCHYLLFSCIFIARQQSTVMQSSTIISLSVCMFVHSVRSHALVLYQKDALMSCKAELKTDPKLHTEPIFLPVSDKCP